jgi:hypothetical protein
MVLRLSSLGWPSDFGLNTKGPDKALFINAFFSQLGGDFVALFRL